MASSESQVYFQTMSSSSAPPPTDPQPSALPYVNNENNTENSTSESSSKSAIEAPSSKNPVVTPARKPLLRLELRDLSSSGTRSFLRLLHASTALEDAVDHVLTLLYTDLPVHCITPTRSVTLILKSMGGVAYTVGSDLDDDHKQIHFSTDYISQIPESRLKEEMMGVIVHEMVHCWQWNALGSAPGGLIEGIADWVRLKAGYAPPHWRRHADGSWDSGYERTGYFLEFLEKDHGEDIVRRINEGLRDCQYEEGPFWHNCCGKSIEKLWKEYQHHLASHENGKTDEKEEA